MLGGKRLTSDESDALWEEMEKAFNTIVADAAKVDADEPWKAAERRGARQADAGVVDRRARARRRSARPACTR